MHQQTIAQPAYSLRPLGAPMGIRNGVKPGAGRSNGMPPVHAVVNGGGPVQKA
jgi:hypothetical protein